ncbi:MAG: hypothetical protein KAT58_10320, partial [candidate division Zixibacteria bacterium]|nr:hypothetical protein [candidate division Zixibacteria bacterium]
MKRIVLLTVVLALALLMAPTSTEAISDHWKREVLLHRLTDTSGEPLDTTVSMIYTIYDDSIGGTVWWTETHPNVTVIGGLVSVLLGAVNPLEDSIFFQRQHLPYKRRWMGIKIGSDEEIRPRTLLTPVPMALCVGTIEGADGGTITGRLVVMDTTSTKTDESDRHGGLATINAGSPPPTPS